MFRKYLFLMVLFVVPIFQSGCVLQRTKELEQQNRDLKTSLEGCRQSNSQLTEKNAQQTETIQACQSKIVKLQQQIVIERNSEVQLRKQIQFCKGEIDRQSQLSGAYKSEIDGMKKALKKAEEMISTLEEQVKILKAQLKSATSQPIEK